MIVYWLDFFFTERFLHLKLYTKVGVWDKDGAWAKANLEIARKTSERRSLQWHRSLIPTSKGKANVALENILTKDILKENQSYNFQIEIKSDIG